MGLECPAKKFMRLSRSFSGQVLLEYVQTQEEDSQRVIDGAGGEMSTAFAQINPWTGVNVWLPIPHGLTLRDVIPHGCSHLV